MSTMLEDAVSAARKALDEFNAVGPPTSNADLVLCAIIPAALEAALDPSKTERVDCVAAALTASRAMPSVTAWRPEARTAISALREAVRSNATTDDDATNVTNK